MQPMCVRPRSAEATRRAAMATGLLFLACSSEDGIVGVMDVGDAGTDSDLHRLVFEAEFDANLDQWEERVGLPGGAVNFGAPSPDTADDAIAVLRFPGDATANPADHVGPISVTQISTIERFHYGTYRTRIGPGACAPEEEVASAALGYFSDGSDQDGDSIADNIEIDIQTLCGSPGLVFLTIYTDYEVEGSGVERFEKLTRVIDFGTGEIFDTPSPQSYDLVPTETRPEWVHPEFPVPGAFYEVGFEWHADSIRFFITLDGSEESLWTVSDTARIPQEPIHFVYNLWHPDSHWFPRDGIADFPAEDVTLTVDWLRIYAE